MKTTPKTPPKVSTAYSYIRFSTPEQSAGDSLTRQTETARRYCVAHDLTLDTSINLYDRGVSAYKGKNSAVGKLSGFLARAEAGEIPRGSTFLVENLDRLSREDVLTALDLLRRIVAHDITVVTLMDNRIYNKETIQDFATLVVALSIMSRATEESATKSVRGKSAWVKQYRTIAEGTPIQRIVPPWLSFDKTTKKMVAIPEKVAVIKRIFSMIDDGHGLYKITKTLNHEGIKTIGEHDCQGRTARWFQPSLRELVRSKKLIGEYETSGKVIKDYFPAILTPEEFYRVQPKPGTRPIKGPATIKNLFTGLLQCGYCGAGMVHTQKTPTRRYLVCGNHYLAGKCMGTTFPYQELEYTVLERGIYDTERLASFDTGDSGLKALRATVTAIEAQIDGKRKQMDKLTESFMSETDANISASVRRAMDRAASEIKTLESQKQETSAELLHKENAVSAAAITAINEMVTSNKTQSQDARRRLRVLLHDVIEKIIVYPDGAKRTGRDDRSIDICYRYQGSTEVMSIAVNDPIVGFGFRKRQGGQLIG